MGRRGGALLGAVSAAGAIASPFVMPLAGLTADRYSRNRVVAISQFLLFLNALTLAMVIQFGQLHVWHLFAFAITGTVLNGFNMPARQALTFDVVPRGLIPNAVALSNIAFNDRVMVVISWLRFSSRPLPRINCT